MSLIRFFVLMTIKMVSTMLFRFDVQWFGDKPRDPHWRDLRLAIILNHTSLLEPLFAAALPTGFLWRIARSGMFPAADKTMNRPIVGRLFRILAPQVISLTRKRDESWQQFLGLIKPDSIMLFLPEGRMKRPNGLDKNGKPMTVRGGIVDVLQLLGEGKMLIAVSGGLHHLRVGKRINLHLSTVDIAAYLSNFSTNDGLDGKGLIADLERIRDEWSESRQIPSRVAAIDLGSSGIKMLIQERQPDGQYLTLRDVRLSTRLGEGVADGAAIPPENLARTKEALASLLNQAKNDFGILPESIPLIATAVVRNAPNGAEFIDGIRDGVGLARAGVLSGEEEAKFGYLGMLVGYRQIGQSTDAYATVDLGGGSFQIALGTRDSYEFGASVQIGSNKIVSKWLPEGLLTAEQYKNADEALAEQAPLPIDAQGLSGRRLVGTGSVSRFLAAHFGSERITLGDMESLRITLGKLPPKDRLPLLRANKSAETLTAIGLSTDKDALDYAIKFPAGVTLLMHIMRQLHVTEMTVSATDVRHLLIAMAEVR